MVERMSKRTTAAIAAASLVIGVAAYMMSGSDEGLHTAGAAFRIGYFRRLGPIEDSGDVRAELSSRGFLDSLGDAARDVQLTARDSGLVVDVVAHAGTEETARRAVDAAVAKVVERHQQTWDAVQIWAGTEEDRAFYLPPISRPTERLGPTRTSPARAGSKQLSFAIGVLAALLGAVVLRQATAFFHRE